VFRKKELGTWLMRVAGSLAEICNERLIIATLTNRRETFVCLDFLLFLGVVLGNSEGISAVCVKNVSIKCPKSVENSFSQTKTKIT